MNTPFTEHPQRRAPGMGPGAPGYLWVLVGVMAVIEALLGLSDAGYLLPEGLRWSAFALGAFWQPLLSGQVAPIYPGQTVVMFLSYAFLHGGLAHLALNSVVLLALGKLATVRIGMKRTLAVLALSAVGGAVVFGLLSTGGVPMIGASGAVFGLLGLWQAWDYRMRKRMGQPLKPVLTTILALIVANVVFFVILGGGLAWEAHLGGWLVGWIAGQSFARS
ncbi:possible Rhomboid family membrane protein [Roseobacter sp. AzwK-3b]|uniref:rhomboid family intramembrane serine protease n=1 Tax=Roseobacter sp. AzwK-3b TaxID=351016 RepID=UPI0001568E13|nr:rhomboid family intramembrane serine protease [Roseobacter sp. AzwK-3b]EDM72871.1 possible Rhomboid family membrane protein [Roseobacter sp. AzwK-3b]